jgi:rare lipoprotein A
MRIVLISIAILQFTISIAAAQPAPDLLAIRPAVIDLDDAGEKTVKPVARIDVLSPPETVVVLPLVALQLLLTGLIGGATSESGIASVYSGGRTASGERTVTGDTTAAHRTMPFGTRVRVTNRANGKSVVVRINDRGPFIKSRIIDLMPASAKALGFSGLTPVTLVVVGRAAH